jgi:hypothetical protein
MVSMARAKVALQPEKRAVKTQVRAKICARGRKTSAVSSG